MKTVYRSVALLVLLLVLLVPAAPVYAQGGEPGKVVIGDNFTLDRGEELAGDLVVIGGNVTIEADASLNGNLVVFGGTVTSDGNINGDMVIFGGQIKLNDAAIVSGDVVTIGGQLDKSAGAEIRGEVVDNVPAPEIDVPVPAVPNVDVPEVVVPDVRVSFNPFWEFARVMGSSLFVAFLAVLAALFFQPRLDKVSQAVVSQPLMVSSMGLLTIVVMVLLGITIIFLPFVLLGLIPLALAWLFGVIALGQEVGDRLAKAMRQDWAPVLTTGIGTFIIVFLVTFVESLNSLLPFLACVTWVLPVLIGLAAIGAVVTTRFGSRPVQMATVPVAVASTPSADDIPPAA
jgi:hypothetical protein